VVSNGHEEVPLVFESSSDTAQQRLAELLWVNSAVKYCLGGYPKVFQRGRDRHPRARAVQPACTRHGSGQPPHAGVLSKCTALCSQTLSRKPGGRVFQHLFRWAYRRVPVVGASLQADREIFAIIGTQGSGYQKCQIVHDPPVRCGYSM